ncbi:MAG: HNH endonuclease [Aggregatilineales bacterium]
MTHIPDKLRQLVNERAKGCCEYCLLDQNDGLLRHEIDHIIAEKHRGTTTEDNLCLSCYECNKHKGSDFASFDPETGEVTMLFHPRRDQWAEHFHLEQATIRPLTAKGRVTVFLLHMNDPERVQERAELIIAGRYPASGLR